MPKDSAADCRKYPLPAEHCVFSLKSFTAPSCSDDDLDVLASDVDDGLHVGEQAQRRLRVRHGFNQGDIGGEDLFQKVFGIAGGSHAKHLHRPRGHAQLAAQIFQNGDGIGNGIGLGKAI